MAKEAQVIQSACPAKRPKSRPARHPPPRRNKGTDRNWMPSFTLSDRPQTCSPAILTITRHGATAATLGLGAKADQNNMPCRNAQRRSPTTPAHLTRAPTRHSVRPPRRLSPIPIPIPVTGTNVRAFVHRFLANVGPSHRPSTTLVRRMSGMSGQLPRPVPELGFLFQT